MAGLIIPGGTEMVLPFNFPPVILREVFTRLFAVVRPGGVSLSMPLLEGGFISGLAIREVRRNLQPVPEKGVLFLQLNP